MTFKVDWAQIKDLVFRMDGRAHAARTEFTSLSGNAWEAEFAIHAGTTEQSPRLMVFFRKKKDPLEPQRYNLAPAGTSKIPKEAVAELSEEDLQELLARSIEINR